MTKFNFITNKIHIFNFHLNIINNHYQKDFRNILLYAVKFIYLHKIYKDNFEFKINLLKYFYFIIVFLLFQKFILLEKLILYNHKLYFFFSVTIN